MLLTSYERDAIRPHVLGRFRDMLLATARHPAMLFYLDNCQSRSAPENCADDPGGVVVRQRANQGLNENYGRELLELHTLGVDGGYTQEDVINVARAFTGWTIFDPQPVRRIPVQSRRCTIAARRWCSGRRSRAAAAKTRA